MTVVWCDMCVCVVCALWGAGVVVGYGCGV